MPAGKFSRTTVLSFLFLYSRLLPFLQQQRRFHSSSTSRSTAPFHPCRTGSRISSVSVCFLFRSSHPPWTFPALFPSASLPESFPSAPDPSPRYLTDFSASGVADITCSTLQIFFSRPFSSIQCGKCFGCLDHPDICPVSVCSVGNTDLCCKFQ